MFSNAPKLPPCIFSKRQKHPAIKLPMSLLEYPTNNANLEEMRNPMVTTNWKNDDYVTLDDMVSRIPS